MYLSIKFSSIFFVFLSEGMKGHQGFIALFFEHIATLLCESLYANILSICLSVFAPFRVATVCQSFFMFPSQPISCCIRQFVCGELLFLTKKWNSKRELNSPKRYFIYKLFWKDRIFKLTIQNNKCINFGLIWKFNNF